MQSPASLSHQMLSVASTFRVLSPMIQLLLAQRLNGHRTQFLTMKSFSTVRHLQAWVLGPLGGPGESPATQSYQLPSVRRLPFASVDEPSAFGPNAHRPPNSILGHALMLPGKHLHGVGSGTSGGHVKSSATLSHQMSSVAMSYRVLSPMIQLLLALRLTGPRAQFLALTSCSTVRHLHGMGAGAFGEDQDNIWRLSLTKCRPCRRSTVCFRR